MPPKRKLAVESYESIEARIQEAIDDLEKRDEEKPNLAAAAREFEVPITRLRARWNGRRSKCDVPGPNKRSRKIRNSQSAFILTVWMILGRVLARRWLRAVRMRSLRVRMKTPITGAAARARVNNH
jgi:hypothetical protein